MEENETIGRGGKGGRDGTPTTQDSVEEKGRARKSGGGQKAGGERRKEREGTTGVHGLGVKGREVRITWEKVGGRGEEADGRRVEREKTRG